MELTFEKWENGQWFVVLPEYDGDQEDLEMVDGADNLLDFLTTDGLYVTADVSMEEVTNSFVLNLVAHDEMGGTYQIKELEGFNQDVWLCNVIHFLFGKHPEVIYFKLR
ncbi:MAG: hypothetical protein J6Y04_01235 [Bacteroidaceae bacterium]|nr:hypothetical protein [Bacteroidaceae bacterium]